MFKFYFITDCKPSDLEKGVWTKIQAVLKEAEEILAGLHSYKGAADDIRKVSTMYLQTKLHGVLKETILLKHTSNIGSSD